MRLGSIHERRGDRRAAATVSTGSQTEHPASDESRLAAPRLKALAAFAPPLRPASETCATSRAHARCSSAGRHMRRRCRCAQALVTPAV